MEPSSPEFPPQEPFERRVQHYQNRAERLLNRYGRDFTRFTHGYEQLVAEGDGRLQRIETTGYNILRRASDMPLASARPLLFYGNYIGLTRHFGLLLATMEQERIITQDQVRFGVRAAKVLYDPEWEEVLPEFAQPGTIQRIHPQGDVLEHAILQSVETVVTFSPRSNEQVLAIARFLNQRAKRGKPGAIEGSNVDPDIRATAALADALLDLEFIEQAQANIRSSGQAQVVVLRKETIFPQPWRAVPIAANEELVGYIVGEGVLP